MFDFSTLAANFGGNVGPYSTTAVVGASVSHITVIDVRVATGPSVLLTNAVIDGTNLVAKEGPALNDRDGVLVLSRNAGAATVMGGALVVNPYDVHDQARALHEALVMPPAERAERAALLRAEASEGSPAAWLDAQRTALREG